MDKDLKPISEKWAEFKFSVVAKLLSSPPKKGNLKDELFILTKQSWIHPIRGERVFFSFSTIESWYYLLKNNPNNSFNSLKNKPRKDVGKQRVLDDKLIKLINEQYYRHRSWSIQLHYDNLFSVSKKDQLLENFPSYSTIRRYFKLNGLYKSNKIKSNKKAQELALLRKESFEINSFEFAFVNGLWHLDFHHGGRQVLTKDGEWKVPILLAVIDDRSRLICHAQWYFNENTENLVHGFIQAIQKRGLPRALMTDNGSAMISQEFTTGLTKLTIDDNKTGSYSPYQNGKIEKFWTNIENRLLPMLENKKNLSLKELNDYTLPWIELDYNKSIHSEIKTTPLNRFLNDKNVSRIAPTIDELKEKFRREEFRKQRKTDGTVLVEGTRYQIPSRYKHLSQIRIGFLKWDLSTIKMIDVNSGELLCQLYPVNKELNANALRRSVVTDKSENVNTQNILDEEVAPLLKQIMSEYSSTGLPPIYIPKE